MFASGPNTKATYPAFVIISLSYVVLPILLLVFIAAPKWSLRTDSLGLFEILCAVPSLVMAAFSRMWYAPHMVRDAEGKVWPMKLQTAALILYAGALLGVLLGIFVSQSIWGVILGCAAFPVAWLIGFRKSSALWKEVE